MGSNLLPILCRELLPSHLPLGGEDLDGRISNPEVFDLNDVLVDVRLVAAADRLHPVGVEVLGLGQRCEVVGLRGRLQHRFGFGHLVTLKISRLG